MTEARDVEKLVFAYLQKKGYKQASAALMHEASLAVAKAVGGNGDDQEVTIEQVGAAIEDTVANYILFHESEESLSPQLFERGYKSLKRWIDNSLDLYQNELRNLLYPVFVHTFLEMVSHGFAREARLFLEIYRGEHEANFSGDIARLVCVVEPKQLAENELALMFRNNKYCVRLCNYSFELFISFLQESKLIHILKIVNQYLNVQGKLPVDWVYHYL